MWQPVIVQNFSLPGSICRKSALDWSADNKIAVCTNKGVYIFSSYCSPVETGFPLPLHKQVIPAPSEALNFKMCNFRPEVFSHKYPEQMIPLILDRTVIPDTSKTSPFLGYRCAKWSPKGAAGSGRCLLATLTMDHQLALYQERDKEWKCICNLSKMLIDIYKESFEEEEIAINKREEHSENEIAGKTSEVRDRSYRLAATEIIWTNMFGSPPASMNDNCYEWCYLIVAMKSGHVLWWRVTPDEGNMVSLAFEWDPDLGVLTSLCWQQTSSNSGFLMCGSLTGILTFTPIDIVLAEKEPDLYIKDTIKLWDEADRVAVDYIAVLKTSVKKYVIVATKQKFLIACEIALTDLSIRISNVGHATGLHKLAVTGLSVLDKVMPQSNIMLSTMDGLIIKIKVTSSQDVTEFHHEPVQLDLDFQNLMVQGLGLSPNGLFCALILSPSVWYDHLAKKEPLQFITFITKPYEEIFMELKKILKPQFSYLPAATLSTYKYIDYFECLRTNLACDGPIPDFVEKKLDVPVDMYDQLSPIELYFLRFVLKCVLSGLSVAIVKEKQDLEHKLQKVDSLIMKHYVCKVISSCQDRIDLLTPAQGQSLLLMADWLYIEHNIPINDIYEAFGFDIPEQSDPIPARETCRICKHPVHFENLSYGQCDQGHKFGRCCQSLLLCDVIPYYQCLSCKSMVLQDVWNFELNCTFCCLPLT